MILTQSRHITIRPYAAADVTALTNLFRASVRQIASRDYTASQVLAWAPDFIDETHFGRQCESKLTWVGLIEGHIAGFSDLEPDGHIDMLYVHPDWQRRAVARALFQHVEEQARKAYLQRLYTESSITARPVFGAMGFGIVAPQTVTVRGESFENYRMAKYLEQPARSNI